MDNIGLDLPKRERQLCALTANGLAASTARISSSSASVGSLIRPCNHGHRSRSLGPS